MAARLSEGCPHSFANQVSLKSSHLINAPFKNAASTGFDLISVPTTLEEPVELFMYSIEQNFWT
jgi:hypothetical protein